MKVKIKKSVIRRAKLVAKVASLRATTKVYTPEQVAGQVFILGSKDGVFQSMIKLRSKALKVHSEDGFCESMQSVAPNDLMAGYNKILRKGLLPDGLLRTEGFKGSSRDRDKKIKYIHRIILKDLPNIPCFNVDLDTFNAVYYDPAAPPRKGYEYDVGNFLEADIELIN